MFVRSLVVILICVLGATAWGSTGAPMVYGVTIPANAPNPAAAEAYVALLLSPRGQEIMERHGQPCLRPAVCGQPNALPPALAEWVR